VNGIELLVSEPRSIGDDRLDLWTEFLHLVASPTKTALNDSTESVEKAFSVGHHIIAERPSAATRAARWLTDMVRFLLLSTIVWWLCLIQKKKCFHLLHTSQGRFCSFSSLRHVVLVVQIL